MTDAAELPRFDGRVVLVTGGCRGIGRGIAQRFADAGAHVAICCRHEPDDLPDGWLFVAADIREPEQVAVVIAATVARFGALDVLVNNAGGSPPADTATASPRFTAGIIALNLTAAIVCAEKANAVMQTQESGGSIVNIASVSGIRPSPNTVAYGAEAGLLNATQTLAVELAPKVRVNAVVVGLVVTEQAHLFYGDEEGVRAVGATVPLGRMADPTDVADVCLFLASPLARYVSGAEVLVHGGGELPSYMAAAKGDVHVSGRLAGKVALVTGAGSGIGAACAQRFADEGARVAGLDITVPDTHPCDAFVAADVRADDVVRAAVDGIVSHLGPVDVLVNAAGVGSFGTADTIDEAEWDRVVGINLKGTWLVARAVLPGMVERRAGSIVNLASIEGIEGGESQTAYNVSKGGVVLLTRSMAVDYGPANVRVNCLCPGMIETPMTEGIRDPGLEPYLDWWRDQHLLGRTGQPEEVAAAALFLASDDASFVTGHALVVDGGYLAGRRFPGTI